MCGTGLFCDLVGGFPMSVGPFFYDQLRVGAIPWSRVPCCNTTKGSHNKGSTQQRVQCCNTVKGSHNNGFTQQWVHTTKDLHNKGSTQQWVHTTKDLHDKEFMRQRIYFKSRHGRGVLLPDLFMSSFLQAINT